MVGPMLSFVILTYSLLTLSFSPRVALANGFRVLSHTASAAGQGNAFMAQGDDPSAVIYNPAGIAQLEGIQVMFGALAIGGATHFKQSASGATSEGGLAGTVSTPPPMHFLATANLAELGKSLGIPVLERVSVGFGMFAPFGLQGRWPSNGPLSTALTRIDFPLVEFRPEIAVKLSDSLSVAVGLDVYSFLDFLGTGKSVNRFRSSGGSPLLPPAGTPIEINGKDTATGFNLSALYSPCTSSAGRPSCSLGFHYRSRADLKLDGKFIVAGTGLFDAQTKATLPQSLTAGFAYWPIRDQEKEWKLEFDFDWTNWRQFKNTDVRLSAGIVLPVPRNWKDSFTPMVGSEYRWLDAEFLPKWDVALRGGYLYSTNVVPDKTFDPALPDNNSHTFAVGLGLLCKSAGKFLGLIPCGESKSWYRPTAIGLDLAYHATKFETRQVRNSQPPLTAPAVVNGTYKTLQHAGLISLRARF